MITIDRNIRAMDFQGNDDLVIRDSSEKYLWKRMNIMKNTKSFKNQTRMKMIMMMRNSLKPSPN